MKNILLLILTVSIILLGCRKNNQNNGDSCYLNSTARSITHDGLNREYIVYVPNSYNGSSSVPLLLNFHGFGGSASEYTESQYWNGEVPEQEFEKYLRKCPRVPDLFGFYVPPDFFQEEGVYRHAADA